MPIQQVQLEEVKMDVVSDETLERIGGSLYIQTSLSYCTICSCNLLACG